MKSPKQTISPNLQSLIRKLRLSSLMLETPILLSALRFALIWDAFPFLTWELTKDGFAFVTVLFTTNSDVFAKGQLPVTYHQLTIRCMENCFVSKRCNTLTSHPSICTCEYIVGHNLMNSVYTMTSSDQLAP